MSRRKTRAFTLIECLVSLLVFGIASGLVVNLFSRYGAVLVFEDAHSRWSAALIAGQRMCQELSEARELTLADGTVTLRKLDPSRFSERLDVARPESASFDPYADDFYLEVDYALSQGYLERTLRRPGQDERKVSLASDLSDLRFEETGKLVRVSFQCRTATKLRQAEFLVERPLD